MGRDHGRDVRAVYDATATAYVEAIGTRLSPDFEGPVDRAVLAAFADLAGDAERPVADLGCGPGRVAAFLVEREITTVGLDLSPAMLAAARDAHAAIPFTAGDLTRLPVRDDGLGGAVCWYSVIHTPASDLRRAFEEIARALVPGAALLVAFQTADDERVHREDAHGSGRPMTSFRHHVDTLAAALGAAGFDELSRTVRQPMTATEATPQAYLLARAR